ncbi:MAG TPA: hypothetical protein VIO33_19130 [Burkholderiaceae bacterium]
MTTGQHSNSSLARTLRIAGMMALAALSGCATTFRGSPEPVTDRAADLASLRKQFEPSAMDACLSSQTEDCRSTIVRARKAAEDIRFYEFEERVFYEGRTTGFAATVSTLGLTTASAATSGTVAKVFAGLAAMITGTREAYDKEVLAEKTLQAIFTTMRANRTTIELRIRANLLKPLAQYRLEDAIGDLEAYRRAGTVQGALDTVTEAAGARARQADQELQEKFGFKPDAAAQKLRLVICGAGSAHCSSLNTAEVARMKQDCWPKANVPANTLVIDFMLQDSFAIQRSQVGACMVPN